VGSMVRAQNNPQGALVMKNLMCQSQQMWKAMELAGIEGGNRALECINNEPGIGSYVKLREQGTVNGPDTVASASPPTPAVVSNTGGGEYVAPPSTTPASYTPSRSRGQGYGYSTPGPFGQDF
jgi:hypothetical protein